MADNIQHEDFGEKIGGAKKDLWKDRGLYVNDLDAMNEREAEKFVKKDNIWKKPDYTAMLDDGIPLGVVYFIKKARDGLNASPQYYRRDDTPEKRLARQKEYIQTVRELQSVVSEVRTVEDAMQVYDRFFVENGYLEQVQGWGSGIHYQATEKGRENPAITNKLSNTLMVRSAGYFERNFTQKAQKEQFGVSKDQKVPKGYAIHFNDGKNTYSKNNDWKPDTYDPWDSGQVGWIYVSKEDALKEFGGEKMTGALRKKAENLMRSEVAAYDSYLRGECYGFELYKNGELTDSCWGFMGDLADVCKDMAEYLPEGCKNMVDHLEEQDHPATIIKTLLKHAKIQVDQAAKAFEHAPRQQVIGDAR